jgi:hypothetical protein
VTTTSDRNAPAPLSDAGKFALLGIVYGRTGRTHVG